MVEQWLEHALASALPKHANEIYGAGSQVKARGKKGRASTTAHSMPLVVVDGGLGKPTSADDVVRYAMKMGWIEM